MESLDIFKLGNLNFEIENLENFKFETLKIEIGNLRT